jgi:hypothetical protein
MSRSRPILHWFFAVMLAPWLLHAQPVGPQAPAVTAGQAGYLIDLRLQASTLTAVSVADIENYVENKHIRSDDDWRVLLVSAGGRLIGMRLIDNPYRLSPRISDDRAIPLTIKVPAVPALAAVVVQDQQQRERLRMPVDDAFRGRAAAARARFLAHDRENRRLVREAAARRAARPDSGQAAEKPPRNVRMETLPRELRDRVVADTAEEMEALLRFGPDTFNRAHALSLAPEQVVLAALVKAERPAAGTAPKGEAAGPYIVTGLVTNANTGAPLVDATIAVEQYTSQPAFVETTFVHTDPAGRYTCGIAAGYIKVRGTVLDRYAMGEWWTPVTGNLTHDIQARPAVALTGRVMNEQAQGVGGVTLQWSSAGGLTGWGWSDASGSYSMLVPANTPFTLTVVAAPAPYMLPPAEAGLLVSADTVRDIRLSTGFAIQGLVSGDGGAAVSGASVLVRQIVGTSTNPRSWSELTNVSGRYAVIVPKNLFPRDVVISVFAGGYVRSTAALTVTGDVTHDVLLARGVTVSGVVNNSVGTAQSGVRLRAFQSGNLVLSTLTDAAGRYSLTLAPGTYTLTAVPPAGQPIASVTVPNLALGASVTQNFTLPSADSAITLKLYCGANERGFGTFARLELRQGARTVEAFLGADAQGSFHWDPVVQEIYYLRTVVAAPGEYDVVVYIIGMAPVVFAGVQVAGAVTLTAKVPAPFVWTGTLRGDDGAAIPGATIYTYDDTTGMFAYSSTDSSGRFSVLMTPHGGVRFFTNEASWNVYYTERFGDVTAGRNADCIQSAFPAFTDTGSPLTQMYGVTNRNSRWNIVMIGDGYTDGHETYTDVNGSGRWDGVLYYDVNHDGVWNTGEPYQVYGTAAAPISGTNPTLGNEPFLDLNGDQAVSLDDQALFDRNTLDTARALFGHDVWRDHHDAFNIFRIRVVSAQAGHDIRGAGDATVLDRNTALGTYVGYPEWGYIFGADDSLVSQYINEYVPETDTRVVVVNQPITMGRVTSYIFTYGGDRAGLCNDTVIGHETGHNVGGLADEYVQFTGTFTDAEITAANVTTLSTLDTIPWKYMVTPGKEIPSTPNSGGVGLFEGGDYYPSGKYRPTMHCAMTMGWRFCPVCRNELEIRLHDIGVPVPVATPLSPSSTITGATPTFTWLPQTGVSHYLLEVEDVSSGQLVASFDVYATAFTVMSPLAAGTYRWRLRAGSTSNWAEWSAWSTFTAAPGLTFIDDPLVAHVTVVRAVHIMELRQAVATLRARFGLPTQVWTDAAVGGSTLVRAIHVAELRTALAQVYVAAGRGAPTYTRPTITPGQAVITAVDIADLRAAVRAIW